MICDNIFIVNNDISKHIKPLRLKGLPEDLRQQLKETRANHGWSQAELGRRSSLPQMHISGIESGKIVPRFDTLLDLVRILDHDLLMIPRTLVPAVQGLIRDQRNHDRPPESDETPLYAFDEEPTPKDKIRR
jgi:transcriptional regulator with XRE-family HTH domain